VIYVLDACAMVAYLNGEPGGDAVEKALLEQDSECLAHAINLCEVYYLFYRAGGEAASAKALNDLSDVGVGERNDFDSTFWQQAGVLKAVHRKVSLADCCAITLTQLVGGTLLTSDHHELDPLAALGICSISFIR
jgi:PIN domain nuclease of toxin-antitoxin system